MSTEAEEVFRAYTTLSPADKLAVYAAISKSSLPESYGPLTDEELIGIAARGFALLDEEEARAEAR